MWIVVKLHEVISEKNISGFPLGIGQRILNAQSSCAIAH